MDYNLLYKSYISGTSIILCQLSGHLLLDNMKMEKQRTGLKYKKIFNRFRRNGVKGIYSGLLPWGILLGYGKGFIVGGVSYNTKNYLNNKGIDSKKVSIYSGVTSGFFEALYMNPIMIARNKINLNQTSKNTNRNLFQEIKFSSNILKMDINNNGIKSLWSD